MGPSYRKIFLPIQEQETQSKKEQTLNFESRHITMFSDVPTIHTGCLCAVVTRARPPHMLVTLPQGRDKDRSASKIAAPESRRSKCDRKISPSHLQG